MTFLLVVWFRKYDQNQDFDVDDGNSLRKTYSSYSVTNLNKCIFIFL